VARNRKRAKERRARRPTNGAARRATATAGFDAPEPIEHASPDVELAEAQMALGRQEAEEAEPDVVDGGPAVEDAAEPDLEETAESHVEDAEPGAEEELASAEFGEAPDVPGVFPEPVRPETAADGADDAELSEAEFEAEAEEAVEEAEVDEAALPVARGQAAPAERRFKTGNRLINFLQGSWRELQRVQWPDRRQVMQATGVVIGFVIVAGVFLGVADFLASKIMNYILTGHFK
jgi:preprotein translocase subunit SecE